MLLRITGFVFILAIVQSFSGDTIFENPVYIIDSVKVPANAGGPEAREITRVKNLPAIGKWMYQDDLQKAHWLGVKWGGRTLIEPINVIFVDTLSKSRDQSVEVLKENLRLAGFTDKPHHSSGYLGYIGKFFYPQLPLERHHAFSDNVAEVENNHGRIFGPHDFNGKYIYSGAFSREIIDPLSKIEHHYGSFDRARDELSQSLDKKSAYGITGYVNLNNVIMNNADSTTGDHDGMAVVLRLLQLPMEEVKE
jgi:hypothetical protein